MKISVNPPSYSDSYAPRLGLASFYGKRVQDKDDMVQKRVGWLLKEAGGKFPDETIKFLTKWQPKIPRFVLRLACEKLPSKKGTMFKTRS